MHYLVRMQNAVLENELPVHSSVLQD